jgi:hypothetical protein
MYCVPHVCIILAKINLLPPSISQMQAVYQKLAKKTDLGFDGLMTYWTDQTFKKTVNKAEETVEYKVSLTDETGADASVVTASDTSESTRIDLTASESGVSLSQRTYQFIEC